jgi:hypothetical protein
MDRAITHPIPKATPALTAGLMRLSLDSVALTACYWAAAAGFAAAFWITPFPPCIDYPQHLAIAATIARMVDPSSPERAVYEVTALTYNGLFQFSTAALSLIVRPETAGRLLLSAIPLLHARAALELMRAAGRPPWYAFALLPFAYSHALGWGFVNYAMGTAIALWVIAGWFRFSRGDRGLVPGIVFGSLLVAFAHVLVTIGLCLTVLVAIVARQAPSEVGLRAWLRDAARAGTPVLPAALYTLIVFRSHRVAPNIEWYPDNDGLDDPAWAKIAAFLRHSVGNLADFSDVALLGAVLVVVVVLWLLRYFGASVVARAERPIAVLAVFWALLYLIVPRVVASTWFVYERLTVWATVFFVAATPVLKTPLLAWIRPLLAGLALASAAVTLRGFARIPDGGDASAIVDEIPEGSRVLGLGYSTHAEPGVWRKIWVHQVAYAMVRRRVETAHQFTRYASLPLRYRSESEPPRALGGLEWDATLYDPDSAYASYWDTVLIRTPDQAPFDDPSGLAFGEQQKVRLLAHRGRFWLYKVGDNSTNLFLKRAERETPVR